MKRSVSAGLLVFSPPAQGTGDLGFGFVLPSFARKSKPPKPQHQIFLPWLLAWILGKAQCPGWFFHFLGSSRTGICCCHTPHLVSGATATTC